MSQAVSQQEPQPTPDTVECECGHTICLDGFIKSRCVNIHEGTALCRCKKWVSVPLQFKED